MVIWSQPARADLKHIHAFIAEDSRYYASKVVQEIKDKADSIAAFPNIGKVVPEIGNPDIRELSLYSYRILYQIDGPNLYILAVIHKRREFKPGALE